MAADNKDGPGLPIGGIAAILVFVTGIVVQQFPLESTRPAPPETSRNRFVGIQDVRARLWQDPFEVVALHQTGKSETHTLWPYRINSEALATNVHDTAYIRQIVRKELAKNANSVTLLGVMVFGGPYPEDAEQRRRIRYAVLSGLGVQGFEPDDSDNIGYIDLAKEEFFPDIVPLEWLNRSNDGKAPDSVLVLWLEEDAFAWQEEPLRKLATLLDRITPQEKYGDAPGDKDKAKLNYKIIGPASSQGLRKMVQETKGTDNKFAKIPTVNGGRIEIYSPSATASNSYLVEDQNDSTTASESYLVDGRSNPIAELLRNRLGLLRTVTTDDKLAVTLTEELKRRGVTKFCSSPDKPARERILLVSEWDTFYGKQLPKQFEAAMNCGSPATIKVSYMRGLDGRVAQPTTAGNDAKAKGEKEKSRERELREFERADGNSQYDYLRRIAGRIRALDTEADGKIKAVGILGSDAYDKLLILQALMDSLPHAVFFTTDLDARLLQQDQIRWTRNLLVASSFGLELVEGIQKNIPPFRDSYQTATFLAVQLAFLDLDSKNKSSLLEKWLGNPRLFEIGRTRAFELTPDKQPGTPTTKNTCNKLSACADIHPSKPDFYPASGKPGGFLVITVLLFVVLLAAYNWTIRDFVAKLIAPPFIFVVLAIATATWFVCSMVIGEGREGEPLLWFEGISIWPTEIIRAVAATLCSYLIYRAITGQRENMEQMRKQFMLLGAPAEDRPLTQRLARFIGTLRTLRQQWPEKISIRRWNLPDGKSVNVGRLWQEYDRRATLASRLWRVVPVALLYIGFATGIFLILGQPYVPYRGVLSGKIDFWVIMICVLLFVFLLFYVVDAIRLCERFIGLLQQRPSEWPDPIAQAYAAQLGISEPERRDQPDNTSRFNDWIDVQFIARHTASVTGLIWYPFIIIALLIVARSALFDNWHMTGPLIVIFGINVGYAIAAAVILQRTAEKARHIAITKLNEKLLRARSEVGVPALAAQFEQMIGLVSGLREGAFRPVSELPLVRAILVSLSSYGGMSIAEYFAYLPN
ncbi:MAG: hypothetical protein K2Y16_01120 [Burkholderiales bacterium]|nr:hypothetical protein [Burkholderiales bacterium]